MADDEAGGDAPSPANPPPLVPDRIDPAEGDREASLWLPPAIDLTAAIDPFEVMAAGGLTAALIFEYHSDKFMPIEQTRLVRELRAPADRLITAALDQMVSQMRAPVDRCLEAAFAHFGSRISSQLAGSGSVAPFLIRREVVELRPRFDPHRGVYFYPVAQVVYPRPIGPPPKLTANALREAAATLRTEGSPVSALYLALVLDVDQDTIRNTLRRLKLTLAGL